MSTAQLTVLWYAGILVSVILLLDSVSSYRLIIVVILFTCLTIYTLKPQPKVNRKTLISAVLTPLALLGLVFSTWIYQQKPYKNREDATHDERDLLDQIIQMEGDANLIELDKVVISEVILTQVGFYPISMDG